MHVFLYVVLPLYVSHLPKSLLQLGVLGLEEGDALLQHQHLLLGLHLLAARVQELLVGQLEGLADRESDFFRLEEESNR